MPTASADEARSRFAALVRDVLEPLRRYVVRRCEPSTVDDVVNEALLVCWRRLDDVPRPPDDPLPWVYGVARRCVANAHRGARRRRRLLDRLRATTPDRPPDAAPPETGVPAALSRLRPSDAEVLRLWAWEELSVPEIAAVLGVTANAAAVRLHRAKRRLRDEFGKHPPASGHRAGQRRRG